MEKTHGTRTAWRRWQKSAHRSPRGQEARFVRRLRRVHGHRHHSNDHRQRGHQHGPDAHKTGFESGIAAPLPSSICSRAKDTIRILFAVATPMHMIAPVSDGTLSVVRVSSSVQQMPASRAGQGGNNNEGIEPRLKIDDDQ